MAELAAEGGCLTTNVQDVEMLSHAIERLSRDRGLWMQLSRQALARPVKNWSDYTSELMAILDAHNQNGRTIGNPSAAMNTLPIAAHASWEDILYPGCLRSHWQMNGSERLALTALLARLKPACSIEVGTYHGGSLSLIAQYSGSVVSIDTDPTVATRIGSLPNVHYLTGNSVEILPNLLKQLTNAGVPVEFILIDGDHSAEGVLKDISTILDYVPTKPLFVLLHDSFNPGCRSGMLKTNFSRSRYCHSVELDFVPGCIVEHGGPSDGELWGGLAMAYFNPAPRSGPLAIGRSAEGMFQALANKSVLAGSNG
jgi:hypothetical protein